MHQSDWMSVTCVGGFAFKLHFLFSSEWHLRKSGFKLKINAVWFPRKKKKIPRRFWAQTIQAFIYQLFTVQLHCHLSASIFSQNYISLTIDKSIPNSKFSSPSAQFVLLLGFRNAWSGLIWGAQGCSLTELSDLLITWDVFSSTERKINSPFWQTWWNKCGLELNELALSFPISRSIMKILFFLCCQWQCKSLL